VPDKTTIWYNQKRSYRIPIDKIDYIKKQDFCLIRKTGIKIKTKNMKKKNFSSVVFKADREEIIKTVESLIS